jgi:hypothetical protein
LEAWLRKRPREVSVAFAARAALRVLPLLQTTKLDERMRDMVLSSFRATAVSWTAAKYPAREKELAARAASAVFVAVDPTDVAALTANAAAQAVRAAYAPDAIPAAARTADYAARADADIVQIRAGSDFDIIAAVREFDPTTTSHAALSGLRAAKRKIWSAVAYDSRRVEEEGWTASDIAGSQLWPQYLLGSETPLWQEMKTALHGAQQDWQVWTIWYDDRLDGRVRDEECELAYVRIEKALWDQGPAVVNAEIKRRIEKLEPLNAGGDRAAMTGIVSPGRASTTVAEPTPPAPAPPEASPEPGLSLRDGFSIPGAPAPSFEAIPEQTPAATNFCINSEGLIDFVPDPPAPELLTEALQRELYSETRRKAKTLAELGLNLLGDLNGPARAFRESLPERIEELSIIRSWSRGNTLRSRLKAHDLSMSTAEPDPARLSPLVAEALRDVVHTWNIFIVGDPKGRELDEVRLGPQEAEEARQVIAAAAPIVEAIERSENVATPLAVEAVAEPAQAAKNAAPGIDGDQAVELSRKTTGNFVAKFMQHIYVLARGEAAFAWEKGRGAIYGAGGPVLTYAAYNNWPAIVSFVTRYADALKEFVTAAWHNPALVEIIDRIVRTLL